MAMFLYLFVFILTCYSVQPHPQCIDSQPPFKPNAKRLWCKDSFKLGCCTKKDDRKLKALYDNALKTVDAQNRSQCRRYLSKVVCLKCHSWSAHIYDVEANPNYSTNGSLPCLDWMFCMKFVTHCAQAIKFIFGGAMKTRNITVDDFCRESEAVLDKDLCYPKIRKTLRQLKNSKPDNIARGPNSTNRGCLCVREVAKNLRNPLALVHANDQTHRLFIVEQIGLIYVILSNGRKLATPFMNISSKILTSSAFGDERGLLGMVFHPEYRKNGRLFVYYITRKIGNKKKTKEWWLGTSLAVLSEWRVSGADLNRVDEHSETVLMTIEQPKGNHNGGQLLFGEDKYLYVFPGDGGAAGDPFGKFGNALNKSTLLGKVLRLDVDKKKPYSIPPDNPFIKESQTRDEIYAYGVRNPWRCSVDRGERGSGYGKGRIFCGDVGQNAFEEIDIIVKGGNYGWRGREGFKCYDKKICKSSLLANEVLPIHAYSHKIGQSVVGGYVYRGCKYPKMRGLYFFADTMNGRMFTLKENKKRKKWQSKEVCLGDSSYCNGPGVSGSYATMILSFGESESGELYFASTEYADSEARKGAVYQLFDPERRTDPSQCSLTIKEPVIPVCSNRNTSYACNIYKNLGFCKKSYVRYMRRNCKLACGLCS